MAGRRGKDRPLSAEDRALWDKVKETVAPLPRKRKLLSETAASHEPTEPKPKDPVPARAKTAPALPEQAPTKAARGGAVPPKPRIALQPLDRRTIGRLVRGSVAIDERIDLHGLTQHDAYARLARFLRQAQGRGAKVVLVITGKGRMTSEGPWYDPKERGVLRRKVPQWLALPEFRGLVVGFEEAHAAHGGAGALYVRLRRASAETKRERGR